MRNTKPQTDLIAVSQPEAARLLSLSARSIYSLRRAGKLRAVKLGAAGGKSRVLIPLTEIDRFIAANVSVAAPAPSAA